MYSSFIIILLALFSFIISINAEDIYQLDDFVVTTATKSGRVVSDVPIKTEVMNLDLFRCFNISELGESMDHFNGIRTESNCQNCGSAEIQLLGLPGNYNQVLIGGVPVFTGISSVYGIDQIPTLFLDQIEVTKGGGSSLYGPGAVAGVINLIPEVPNSKHGHFNASLINIDGSVARGMEFVNSLSNQNDPIQILIYGKDAKQDSYDRDLDGFSELVKRDNSSLGSIFSYKPTKNSSLKFSFQTNQEYRRGGSTLELPSQYSQVSESLDTDYKWAILQFDQQLNEKLSLYLSSAYVDFSRNSFYGGTGAEIINTNDPNVDFLNQTYNGASGTANAILGSDSSKAYALFGDRMDGKGGGSFNQFGELDSSLYYFDMSTSYAPKAYTGSGYHNFILGFQYEKEAIYDENVNLYGDVINILHDESYENISLYFQDEWRINQFNELLLGGRIDNVNILEEKIFSPRVAWIYDLDNDSKFRANYSTGFLSPRIFSEDTHINNLGGIPVDVVNSENLKHEESKTISLGMDYDFSGKSRKSLFSIQLYYTKLSDSFLIEEPGSQPVIEDGRIKVERVNTDGSKIYGLEFDFEHDLSETSRVYLGFSYNKSRYNSKQEVFSGLYTDVHQKIPEYSGIFQYRNKFSNGFNFVSSLKWTGSSLVFRNTDESIQKTSDFFVFDIAFSKEIKFMQFPALNLSLSLNNLFDSYQSDFESGVMRDAEYVYGPRKPRNISFSGEMKF